MKIDAPTMVPLECYTLVEELVRNAVEFGRASIGHTCALELDEYSVLTYQRKFLYEYLETNLHVDPRKPAALLRFR